MPNTPRVDFNFQNNNVGGASVPQLGVSKVLARTTKGPFNDGSTLIRSYTQFQNIFGEEIVPDGSISNIRKALEGGSQLRIFRVSGANQPDYGYAYTDDEAEEEAADRSKAILKIRISGTTSPEENYIEVNLNIRTKEMGSAIVDPKAYGQDQSFYLGFQSNLKSGSKIANAKITLIQFLKKDSNGKADANSILSSDTLFSYSNPTYAKGQNGQFFIDGSVLQAFVNNVPNIVLELAETETVTGLGEFEAVVGTIKSMDDVIALLKAYSEGYSFTVQIQANSTPTFKDISENTPWAVLNINEGNNGGDSNVQTWIDAYTASREYVDAYQVIASHVHLHLPDYYTDVLGHISDICRDSYEEVLFVEVPKYASWKTEVVEYANLDALVNQIQSIQGIVGTHKLVAYFGGGLKYYNENGMLKDCDVLGTVLGLADTCATAYGPWYSFAGMNRGVVANAIGPVIENYGSPLKIDSLQELAENFLNLFVIKDTRGSGKQTMLWHSFTATPYTDSERFLSIVRLNLYLKKNLRPILESYLEEPNIWDTWLAIYYQVLPILEDLVNRNAMSEFHWNGDQFAKSYEDLQVNNEADVRQGKYKVNLVYKDIVTMQEISMNIIIDAASNSVNIETEE